MAGSAWTNQLVNLIILVAQQLGVSGFFVYSPTPGTGNLVLSIAAVAGTDEYHNPYPAGLAVGVDTGTQLNLVSVGGVGQLLFLLNNVLFGNGLLESAVIGGFGQIVLNGPKLLSLPDFVGAEWNSNTGSGSANWELVYTDGNGTSHLYLTVSDAGVGIQAGTFTVVEPGTGTSPFNPAVAEGPHLLSVTGGWGTSSLTYELLPQNMVCIEGGVVTPSSGAYNNVVFATLPTGYQPGTVRNYPCVPLAGTAYGNASFPGAPRVIVSTNGNMSLWGIPGSLNNQTIDISGVFSL